MILAARARPGINAVIRHCQTRTERSPKRRYPIERALRLVGALKR